MQMISRDDKTLKHYGIIGMHWGIRRLEKKIFKAEKKHDTIKVSKLKKRLIEEKQIDKLKTGDKFNLSREGVLANMRLMAKGESRTKRLLKLHALGIGIRYIGQKGVSAAARPIMTKILQKCEGEPMAMLGASVGFNTVAGVASSILLKKASDAAYKKIV